MKQKTRVALAFLWLTIFVAWTLMVCFCDVQEIGPQGSEVGLASLNRYFHQLTGVHLFLYEITDCLSLVPLGFVLLFAVLGLAQWIQRKQLRRVDVDLLLLGGFYVIVLLVYCVFEITVINYRPVLLNGGLESSYPSSTTLLVLCVMPTVSAQSRLRLKNKTLKNVVLGAVMVFSLCMVAGRLVSGVHWVSDIIGGLFLSAFLVTVYRCALFWGVKS